MLGLTTIGVGLAGGESPTYLMEQVATDAHDYYAGHGEAEGQWIGSGCKDLGLDGSVTTLEFGRVLSGNDPTTGEALNRRAKATKVMGIDATFSAPKSVSLAWGMGDDWTRQQVQAAHDAAVADALGYIERNALRTRRGAGGKEVIETTGLIAGAFRHRTSRAGDPDLHTHVAMANVVKGSDGVWRTIHGGLIYNHAKTAGYVYQARLRHEVTERLGLGFDAVTNGYADLLAVPEDMQANYSKRRREIVQHMRQFNRSGAKAAQMAAMTTRSAKADVAEPDDLHGRWRAEAAAMGWSMDELLAEAHSPTQQLEPRRILEHLAGADGMTEQRTSFSRRDVIQAVAAEMPAGATAETLETMADDFLSSDWVQVLEGASLTNAEVLRRGDGRVVATGAHEGRFTTTDLLEVEQGVVERAEAGRRTDAGVAEATAVALVLRSRPTLGSDQRAMVEALTTSGDGVQVVVAKAGTGKTYTVDACREAWEMSGQTVIGVAPSAKAAKELEAATGMPAQTIDRWLLTERGPLPRRTVVVVDEAGMVGSRKLAAILNRAAADTKVVLIGDPRQLPSIDAGGTYRLLSQRLGHVELTENRRFRDSHQEQAADDLRAGRVAQAMARYEDLGLVNVFPDAQHLHDQMVANWWSDRGQGVTTGMWTDRVRDAEALNDVARAVMRNDGRIGGDELTATSVTKRRLSFAVGDEVMTRKNDYGLGVMNNDVGTVTAINNEARTMTVAIGDRAVTLPSSYIDGTPEKGAQVAHAYARTTYRVQGATVDRGHYLGSESTFGEAGYVAQSRGRESNAFYVVDCQYESVKDALEKSRAHVTAIEQLRSEVDEAMTDPNRRAKSAWEIEAEFANDLPDPAGVDQAWEIADDAADHENQIDPPGQTIDPGGAERKALADDERRRRRKVYERERDDEWGY